MKGTTQLLGSFKKVWLIYAADIRKAAGRGSRFDSLTQACTYEQGELLREEEPHRRDTRTARTKATKVNDGQPGCAVYGDKRKHKKRL